MWSFGWVLSYLSSWWRKKSLYTFPNFNNMTMICGVTQTNCHHFFVFWLWIRFRENELCFRHPYYDKFGLQITFVDFNEQFNQLMFGRYLIVHGSGVYIYVGNINFSIKFFCIYWSPREEYLKYIMKCRWGKLNEDIFSMKQ